MVVRFSELALHRRILIVAALAVLGLALATVLATFVPLDRPAPTIMVVATGAGAAILFTLATAQVIYLQGVAARGTLRSIRENNEFWRAVVKRVPSLPRLVLQGMTFAGWVSCVALVFGLWGTPEQAGDRSATDENGHRTEITSAQQQGHRAMEHRYLAGWSATAMAMIILPIWGLPPRNTLSTTSGSPPF